MFDYVAEKLMEPSWNLKCVLVDEAQFLSKEQVTQLADIPDQLKIPADPRATRRTATTTGRLGLAVDLHELDLDPELTLAAAHGERDPGSDPARLLEGVLQLG